MAVAEKIHHEQLSGMVVTTIDILGGKAVVHTDVLNGLDAHNLITQGLPSKSVKALQDRFKILRDPEFLQKAVGISIRTAQRKKELENTLSESQSGRVWKFAELMSKASNVLGSEEEAERWLTKPAMGLEQQRPIDLMSTPAGVELVEELLGRMEYGVYA